MAHNFLACDRDQELLLPPNLRDWLPADHLAWFVLETVDDLDLNHFYADYRVDGWGRAAYEPKMMVALVLYAYAVGERSSRRIERELSEDVAFRVIAANQTPDHATIARFLVRHQDALSDLFGQVLSLCARAGLVQARVVAIDSTKLAADASGLANRDWQQIAKDIVAEGIATDAAEDELYGEARGDELRPELRDPKTRRDWIRRELAELERDAAERPAPNSRPERLREAKRRLEERHQLELDAIVAERRRRAEHEALTGRRPIGRPPKDAPLPEIPAGRVNTTDPDSSPVKTHRGFIQGYNAQAATTADQIVIASELTRGSGDQGQLEPLVRAATDALAQTTGGDQPQVVLADAGYWSKAQLESLAARGVAALVPPDGHARRNKPPPGRSGGPQKFMRATLAGDTGRALYRRRQVMVEPVFAQIKVGRRAGRFRRRGWAACRAEWRLITATHNLLKLQRFTQAAVA
jgi:transposase